MLKLSFLFTRISEQICYPVFKLLFQSWRSRGNLSFLVHTIKSRKNLYNCPNDNCHCLNDNWTLKEGHGDTCGNATGVKAQSKRTL